MTVTTTVLAGNPSMMTGPGTNTYLVGDGGGLACIDPGPDDDAHLEAVIAAASERGGRITVILLTHSHPDHRPLARRLAEVTGAQVRCFDTAAGDEEALPLRDGDAVTLDGTTLVAVHTPGHAADHVCFHDPGAAALYTGDHILAGTTAVIFPEPGAMSAYFDSLRRVRALQPRTIHPGHGPRIDDAVAIIEQYIEHRLERERQVLGAARTQQTFTPRDLVEGIYAGYPVAVHALAALSVQAHLDKLADDGLVTRLDGDGLNYRAL